MSQGQATMSHTLALPQCISRSKKTEITSFSQTHFNTDRYSSIPLLDRANLRPVSVASLCHLSIPLSLPLPPPTHPVLQIREIQTSNERLCDYELHQHPALRAKPDKTSGKKGERSEEGRKGRKECKWEESQRKTRSRGRRRNIEEEQEREKEREGEREAALSEGRTGRETEKKRELIEGYVGERQRRRKGVLKAAVTPVTSHLSNPAPT